MGPKPHTISGWNEPEPFEQDGISRWLYQGGSGPGVVLLHELPGMSVECRQLGDRLIKEGYAVYMPLLFGKPESVDMASNTMAVCISREIHVFSKRGMGPITDWIRALCRHALGEQGGKGVGLIGMCLTGNFALSLVADPEVLAPVACQPSLPIAAAKELAMDEAQLAAAKKAAKEKGPGSIIGFRYEKDGICPRAKFERIRAEFGDSFDGTEIPGPGHSTLTEHLDDGALSKTLGFFKARLH